MGNTLLPNNPTLDDIKKLIKKINSKIKIINASVNQETLNIDSPIATIIQSESTDPGEYTTTDIDTNNFYTKNEINTLLENKVNVASIKDMAYINDAPSDNKDYARKNGEWSEITNSGASEWGNISGTLSNQTDLNTALNVKANLTDLGDLASKDDAPSDGSEYVRKNGAWVVSSGGSSGTTAWGDITGILSNQTDLNTALNEKADASTVYTKTEADNLLSAKANTADLGGMAAEDDAPSDDSEYVRKNGAWVEPSGGGTSGVATLISGLNYSLNNIVRTGNVVALTLNISVSSGTMDYGSTTTVATIPSEFRPKSRVESGALFTQQSASGTFGKARIDTNGNVGLQIFGSTKPTWCNIFVVYII